ncbi:Ig-like domain-containing protein [Rhodocytophaga rosea]|uniref:Ig-like domain-containing protein n=1 Tax=Rhodocytophaga rosea TaxID=2704465 RepID=A0A6C0GPT7_9BACT|nr:Ig-like domain-containing protein [Rhodocytophaga rosea]QHT69854.1 Ig-like domain-containing protein [Rhodocytophaga rosea]
MMSLKLYHLQLILLTCTLFTKAFGRQSDTQFIKTIGTVNLVEQSGQNVFTGSFFNKTDMATAYLSGEETYITANTGIEPIKVYLSEDTLAPVLTSFSPDNGATEIATNTYLVLVFSEEIIKGTGNIIVSQGGITQVIPVNNAVISVAGNQVTIVPDSFTNNSTISISITAGTFKDLAGNEFAGLAEGEWIFTTVGQADIPSALISFSPMNDENNVSVDATLSITFNEEVFVGSGEITIKQGNTTQIIELSDERVSIAGTTVTINPDNFPGNTLITVSIPSSAFVDVTGYEFAGITDGEWSFTTVGQADTPPVITSFSPENTAGNVPVNASLTISFNEEVFVGSGEITLTQGSSTQILPLTDERISIAGNTVTINPDDFPYSTSITVSIPSSVFVDSIGYEFAGIVPGEWSFTTVSQPEQSVVKFILVNADTDRPLMPLEEGDVIDLSKLPTQNLNIQVITNPGVVGSVLIDLDGKLVVENQLPYAYGGGAGTNYNAITLPVGNHTLTATPYSERTAYTATTGNGLKGKELTIHFTITGTSVNSLVLLNADTNEDILALKNGDVIDLANFPAENLNIRAITNPERLGSVVFKLNELSIRENHFPYAIGGDINGDFRSWTLPAGNHTLTATPYQYMGSGGKKGAAHTVSFSVVNTNPAARINYADNEGISGKVAAFPNPFHDRTLISFSTPDKGYARLEIYDAKGLFISSPYQADLEAGKWYSVVYEAGMLKSGVYVVKLVTQRYSRNYKLVLTK